MKNRSIMKSLYYWRVEETRGGEVWAKGIRINGKPYDTMVFAADLSRMEFDTPMGIMKFEVPDETFRRNVEARYGSMEVYLRGLSNLECRGRMYL